MKHYWIVLVRLGHKSESAVSYAITGSPFAHVRQVNASVLGQPRAGFVTSPRTRFSLRSFQSISPEEYLDAVDHGMGE